MDVLILVGAVLSLTFICAFGGFLLIVGFLRFVSAGRTPEVKAERYFDASTLLVQGAVTLSVGALLAAVLISQTATPMFVFITGWIFWMFDYYVSNLLGRKRPT